ncbi:nucleotidyl transferase AbiEii/AbiGii toxin family protein [Nostoc sp.]
MASQVRLYEHSDFKDAIKAAKEHFAYIGLTEQFIEKDYYVTEALRIVAQNYPNQVIFKGGTSLSKGWKLIERFSEDIDLFLNRDAFNPPLSQNGIYKTLEAIQILVDKHPGLTLDKKRGNHDRKSHRNSFFNYVPQFSGNNTIASTVYLEMGTRSGNYPIEEIYLSSYIGQFLQEIGDTLNAEDESSFSMKLLHFRRTFVEKLFAIHSKILLFQEQNISVSTHTRHYYDLFCLAQHQEVQEMLKTEEFNNLKQDCHNLGQQHFNDHRSPEYLSFSNSEAIYPTGELRQSIIRDYSQQCRNLCYGNYPTWEEIELCFKHLRDLL